MKNLAVAIATSLLVLAGCEQANEDLGPGPFESRYQALPSGNTLITGATVLTGAGERLDDAGVLIVDGKIAAIAIDRSLRNG